MADNRGNKLSIKEGFKFHFNGASNASGEDAAMKEQDHQLLPIANVGRIMKQVLPPNAKISKEAKETVQECVSEFISFVTGEASDKCHMEKRKTVNGDDICWAVANLGFDDYGEPLRRYLLRYRELDEERAQQVKLSNDVGEEKNETSIVYGSAETPKKRPAAHVPSNNSSLSRRF